MPQGILELKVTRIHKLSTTGPMKAFVDMSVNDALLIRGVRVIEGQRGLFICMPQEKGKDNKWYDTVRCLSQEVRYELTERVLEAYKNNAEIKS